MNRREALCRLAVGAVAAPVVAKAVEQERPVVARASGVKLTTDGRYMYDHHSEELTLTADGWRYRVAGNGVPQFQVGDTVRIVDEGAGIDTVARVVSTVL